MGERDFYARYQDARRYADHQADAYLRGEATDTYRGITGAAWVAEAYDIAASDAQTLVSVQGAWWEKTVDECKRLAEHYRTLTNSRTE